MKWQYRNGYWVGREPVSAQEVVRLEVGNADGAGRMETLQAKLDKLTEIVGLMLEAMPESKQREVIANLYEWEEVK